MTERSRFSSDRPGPPAYRGAKQPRCRNLELAVESRQTVHGLGEVGETLSEKNKITAVDRNANRSDAAQAACATDDGRRACGTRGAFQKYAAPTAADRS